VPAAVTRSPLPVLTSLRFFAAMEVVFVHFLLPKEDGFINCLLSAGHQAVTFFFVLSGFILVYVYNGKNADDAIATSSRAFWKARFARIYPAFALSLLIGLPALLYETFVSKVEPLHVFWSEILLIPVLLQAWFPGVAVSGWNSPSWSLSVEALFYAVFPLLMRLFRRIPPLRLATAAFGLAIAVVVLRWVIQPAANAPKEAWNFDSFFPLLHLPSFIFGMAVGRVFLFAKPLSPRAHLVMFWLGLVTLIAVIGWRYRLDGWVSSDAILVPLFGLIIFGGARPGISLKPLKSRMMILLGEVSYAIYIIHLPLLFWWQTVLVARLKLNLPPALGAIAFATLVTLLSILIFRYVENPLRRRILGHRAHKAG